MRSLILLVLPILCCIGARATRVTGIVRDEKGNVLPYSSILIKGTTRGVTAGGDGRYSIELSPGQHILVCQYVGYQREEKSVTVGADELVVDFRLSPLQLSMAEVVVRPGGEDPAYAIIRHAIKKRRDYENPLDSFTCEAYIKTLMRTRGLPKRILGQKIQESDKKDMGVDSAGKGIIFLSESLTKVAFKRPDRIKLEVLSGRQSGSNGYGFSIPTFINFYKNNVAVLGDQLNPRGFVSPIADAALAYYRYKFLGSYFEDGKEINEIQVIPRRKYEPLFSGKIDIIDGEWRIHSLDLRLLRESQLEILDTLEIKQIHAPVGAAAASGATGRSGEVWLVKSQVIYFTFNILGIDAVGNFLNVYNNYDVAPVFRRRYFNNVLIRYDTAGNRKTKAYWDSIRPLPLEPDEKINYVIRDSIYRYSQDSMGTKRNRDSLLKRQGPVKAGQLLIGGFNRSDFRQPRPMRYSMEGLLPNVSYNTVEGINLTVAGRIGKRLRGGGGDLSFSPHFRYGFNNHLFNAWGELTLDRRSFSREGEEISSSRQSWTLAGGRRVAQYNPDNPISEVVNALYTLLRGRNYMKIYESRFAELRSATRFDNGMRLNIKTLYEDRRPLENTTYYSFVKPSSRAFTGNYPWEIPIAPQLVVPHQALVTTVDLEYQPGQRFIEYPNRKVSIGSKYPTFTIGYAKGWEVLGSDVNFDKWSFSVRDAMNFRLRGELRYRFSIGGFLNANSVYLPDYQHFNGNQTLVASEYLNSFQVAPYYANSTTENFYATAHLEHHFNGFLTNKIPLFRRLNWHLVGGGNAFYVNGSEHYEEMFWGLENIFKLLRVDVVASWRDGRYWETGVRVGFGGLLGGGRGQR
ncbi:MAG TPA: DUF5686 and carboxypeptidase regulatory-like domain-containing protein [Puia sp.]|uniref:DUF5686 and carboxypeptidase regulatory-like domain-containing protein n=1 Tax=Puia sp. TaxID=2045100 RepID=UPI002CBEFCE6|nr:DUF5686 and carboxypeptidase regulatory-like domain-containing protein [Puia sp.]HVU97801.1 DUF5686 and carboxypeptidase regulatory-like domain-containing protein [Puia sp.]